MSNSLSDSPSHVSTSVPRVNRVLVGTAQALVGGLLIWLAFPPVSAAPLAWLGAAIWVWLCTIARRYQWRDYLGFYLAALFHWALVIHWVRLPHWSAWFGWLALSAYLALYLPLFIALVRQALRAGIPLVIAAPMVWCGLEAIRARAMTGFAMMMLGHTQVEVSLLIQIADLFGAYTVSFLIVLVAAAAAQCLPQGKPSIRHIPVPRFKWSAAVSLLIAIGAMVGTLLYGQHRLSQKPLAGHPSIRVALIQGSIDTLFDGIDHSNEVFTEYIELSQTAGAEKGPFDLVIWPESMYAYPWISIDATGPMVVPDKIKESATEYRDGIRNWKQASQRQAQIVAAAVGTRMLAGAPRLEFGPRPVRRFNTAILLSADGTLVDYYDKMHPVLFGETIPLGNVFPWLYRLSPMGSGLEAGTTAKCFDINGIKLAPNICFEDTVPHLIRRQYLALRSQGTEPDALVTITNDGWFWGSSLLDAHLACGVFRAIEMRRPLLISANTGFSAWIDDRGRVLARGPRRAVGVVAATVESLGPSKSVYLACGDLPVGTCAALCLILAIGLWRHRGRGDAS
jgi:apolipoprotein N-acyltransferase